MRTPEPEVGTPETRRLWIQTPLTEEELREIVRDLHRWTGGLSMPVGDCFERMAWTIRSLMGWSTESEWLKPKE